MANLPEQVTGLAIQITTEKAILWEEHLKLYIKPRPAFIPEAMWIKMLDLVLFQTRETIDHGK